MEPSSASVHSSDDDMHHEYTARDRVARYTGPAEEALSSDQRRLRHAILASRPRTGASGPFGPWLAVPAIADPAQLLGQACRYGTSLSVQESELVILLTGAKLRSHAEFDIHVPEALRAGLSKALIQAIPRDDHFSLQAVTERVIPLLLLLREVVVQECTSSNDTRDETVVETPHTDHTTNTTTAGSTGRIQAIALFAAELLDTCTISDTTYATTKLACGGHDSVLVEITAVVGYYSLVCYTLNVFQIPSS